MIEEYQNYIIIVEDSTKKSLLKNLNKLGKLTNIKIITLTELKKKYYFDYDEKTVYYVCKKYNVKPELANIFLENLYYIYDINSLNNKKIEFLTSLKEDLDNNKLLLYNDLFKKYLDGKEVYLIDRDYIDSFYINILNKLNCIISDSSNSDLHRQSKKQLFSLLNKNEEIVFVANEIVKLINNGIDINKIKISNVQKDYYFTIKNIFKKFNIPLELNEKKSITSTILYKKFIEFFSNDINNVLNKLNDYVKDVNDEKVLNKIIQVLNNYAWVKNYEDVFEFIKYDLKSVYINNRKYKNAIREVDISTEFVSDDEYVFLINYNQGVIPLNYKDEDFLNDEMKTKLEIDTSIIKNIKNTKLLNKKILEIKNLIVTYSKYDINNELYISNSYDPLNFIEDDIENKYTNSNQYNREKLVTLKDENRKFGTVSEELMTLNRHYSNDEYLTYDNQFKGINLVNFNRYLDDKLVLSYSSINNYYKCGFKYYLENILNLNKFEDSFETVIGNIFHECLSHAFNGSNIDELWDNAIKKSNWEFKPSELFFLNSLKDELNIIVDTIKEQMSYTKLNNAYYEKKIEIPINDFSKVIFKGFVDKILYKTIDNETIAVVIDYKTGNPNINLDNAYYGIDMQLPIYVYLLKKSKIFNNIKIGGFYLQKILTNSKTLNEKHDNLKLQGYSNSDLDVLENVDSSYTNSKIIKSLKMGNNGFYAYSKVLDDNKIDKLTELVESKIKEASNDILNAKFDINPKQIDNKNIGCNYCKFKDICFMTNKNILNLKHVGKDDFLGGEKDAEMD